MLFASIVLYARAKTILKHWERIACSDDEKVKSVYNELLELEEKISALELLKKEHVAKVAFLEAFTK